MYPMKKDVLCCIAALILTLAAGCVANRKASMVMEADSQINSDKP